MELLKESLWYLFGNDDIINRSEAAARIAQAGKQSVGEWIAPWESRDALEG